MRTKIRRRGSRWYVYAVDVDGKEHGHGGFRTQREAKVAAAALVADAARGRYVTPGKLTVGAYLNGEWLESRLSADISPGTRETERTMVAAWIVPHIGDIVLQKLTARDVDGLYRTLRERGGRGGTRLKGKSVRNVHVTLSKALGDAVKRGHIVVNPVAAVDPPARDDSIERVAWSKTEAQRFLRIAADDRLAAVWRLALASGLRRGELIGLRWPDIDDGAVAVQRQVLVTGSGARRVYVRATTKSHRVRRVRIDPETAAALRRWKAAQATERLAFGPAYKDDGGLGEGTGWVVTEADGSVIHPDTLLRRWVALVARAGVTPITLHGARHSFAEIALASGARIDIVSRALGHASISTTANIYTHDNDEAASEAAAKVAAALEGGH